MRNTYLKPAELEEIAEVYCALCKDFEVADRHACERLAKLIINRAMDGSEPERILASLGSDLKTAAAGGRNASTTTGASHA